MPDRTLPDPNGLTAWPRSPLFAAVPTRAQGQAYLLLLAAAMLWGSGNVANKTVLDNLNPLWVVVLRCAVAAAVLAPLALREGATPIAPRFPAGFGRSVLPVGGLFTLALAVQQSGFADATATNAGFLMNTTVVLPPVLAWMVLSEQPLAQIVLAAALTMAGVFLMTGATFDAGALNRGDLLCFLSTLLYAGWTVALGVHARRHGRPFLTALAQITLAAVLVVPLAASRGLPTGAALVGAAPEVLLLGVFATAAAFTLMTAAQRHVPTSMAAVIVSAESVFGTATVMALLGEVPAALALAGGVLILGAIAQTAWPLRTLAHQPWNGAITS